ncbi:MAG TPA: hypothetical protein VHK91_17265 [Flavisolibacter sp.]|jgi:hypothetical protein|nr:hypothetical protein [Flavisolibacter sp.]
MENLIFLLTASLVYYKSARKSRKVFIGNTNCSFSFSAGPLEFDITENEQGDTLYLAESQERNVSYGILCADLHEKWSLEEGKAILLNYMERLQKPFQALYNTGISDCTHWHQQTDSCTVMDYWQDQYQQDWKLKGYTNGKIIALLYVKNIGDAEASRHDHFLDSFCFAK